MLQSMTLQRYGHNLELEQQQYIKILILGVSWKIRKHANPRSTFLHDSP